MKPNEIIRTIYRIIIQYELGVIPRRNKEYIGRNTKIMKSILTLHIIYKPTQNQWTRIVIIYTKVGERHNALKRQPKR